MLKTKVETKSKSDYIEKDSENEVAVYIFVKKIDKFEDELENLPMTKELLPEGDELATLIIKSGVEDIKIKLSDSGSFDKETFEMNAPQDAVDKGRKIVEEAWDLSDQIAVYQLYIDGVCEAEST